MRMNLAKNLKIRVRKAVLEKTDEAVLEKTTSAFSFYEIAFSSRTSLIVANYGQAHFLICRAYCISNDLLQFNFKRELGR